MPSPHSAKGAAPKARGGTKRATGKKPKGRSAAAVRAAINDVLDNVRFYIQRDGGDLRFVGYAKGVATIEVLGACVGCALIDVTYKAGVETILRDEVAEVKEVRVIDRSQTAR